MASSVGSRGHNNNTSTPTRDPMREAAALAEWSSKTRVWIPDERDGFVAGWVVKEEDGLSTVAVEASGELRQIASVELSRINPPAFDGADDIAELTYLNEASVVHNLRTRYDAGSIYTYSGLFLVAVNPYRSLSLYAPKVISQYKRSRREANPPHVFAVAEEAWQKMTAHAESQSILVTGESGAGKTETTKKVIQYLAAIAGDPSTLPASTSFDRLAQAEAEAHRHVAPALGQLERKIIEANPILEAFGNAQTMKNDNSSRFGKFVRIFFSAAGAIVGANIDWYLLEKSRVTARGRGERNYHIFYQLLAGADLKLKKQLLLGGGPRDYEYLKHSAYQVSGVDDLQDWNALQSALDTVGFSPSEKTDLFRTLAAILHLGNIQVAGSEQAHFVDRSQVERAAFLLGIDDSDFANALVRPKVKAGREWVTQARTPQQVVDELAALSKTLYEKMFGAIVDRVNKALGRNTTKTFIGVLDIAGFEIFETNGFEQLLINLNNEKLQQFFNHQAFVLEQEEYAREEIAWEFVNFGLELQPTIDLIEANNPMGILSCLDDETFMPKGSDRKLVDKLNRLAKGSPDAALYTKYTPSRLEQGFTVSHYAGNVEYRTDGWLTKNRDPLNENLTSALSHSSDGYVAALFSEFAEAEAAAEGPRTRVRKGAFRTVGQRHKEQLATLMSQLAATQPHFIRCIVPNVLKSPKVIDVPLVLAQLRCNGVLEGIRIARIGFPNRLPFAEFRRRFGILAESVPSRSTFIEGKEACTSILQGLNLDPASYRLGLTKVFFKAGILAELEGRRDERLADIVTRLQATCRRFATRRKTNRILHRTAAVEMIQRNARLYIQLRQWPWWKLFQQVRPLLAAARSDDEMRRKEAELVAIKEKAELETAERIKLEQARADLEAQRAEMERALSSERALLQERDLALERSQQREAQLQEQLAAAESDIETVDRQLERAMAAKKESDQRVAHLDSAFANQLKLLETLQAEQTAWKAKEAELSSQTSIKTAEWERVLSERDRSQVAVDELGRRLAEEVQDRRREEERLVSARSTLEQRLSKVLQESAEANKLVSMLEDGKRRAAEETASLRSQKAELDGVVKTKSAEVTRLTSELTTLRRQSDATAAKARELEIRLSTVEQDLRESRRAAEQSESSRQKNATDLLALQRLLDEQTSDHQKSAELNRMKEAEVKDLRLQLSKASSELAVTQRDSTNTIDQLRRKADSSQIEISELKSKNTELGRQASSSASRVVTLEGRVQDLERHQQAHDLELEMVRNEVAEKMLQEREEWEKKVASVRAQFQALEDAVVESRRKEDAAKRDARAAQSMLEAERRNAADKEDARHRLEVQVDQQHAVLADFDKINGDLRSELASTKARLVVAEEKAGRTVVEHVRVLEEALRLQNSEMDRIRNDRAQREARMQTLEKAKDSLTRSLEDMQAERDRDRRDTFRNQPPPDQSAARAMDELRREKRIREEAELNVSRLRSEIAHLQKQVDTFSVEIKDLKRQNSQFERDLAYTASSDHSERLVMPRNNLKDSRLANISPLPHSQSYNPHRLSMPTKPSSSSLSPSPTPASPRRRGNYE